MEVNLVELVQTGGIGFAQLYLIKIALTRVERVEFGSFKVIFSRNKEKNC